MNSTRLTLVATISLLASLAAACGEPASSGEEVVVVNNGGGNNGAANNGGGNNGGGDPLCAAMNAGINDAEGATCTESQCPSIPCACADGGVVNTSSCFNGFCEGLEACESACGTVRDCGSSSANNAANNGSTGNNASTNNGVNNIDTPGDDGMQGDSCTCSGTGSQPQEDRYQTCYGTEDGCDGTFGPLECVYNLRTSQGTCRVECSEDDYLTSGPCPAGSICDRFPSLAHDDLNPNYFYACD